MSVFNGVRVFSATMAQQRQELDEKVNAWIAASRRQFPGFEIVDIKITQSSDEAFHCIAITVFYKEDTLPKEKSRG